MADKHSWDYMDTWYRLCCPECESENWICDGDTFNLDYTRRDVAEEPIRCWKCRKAFWLGEEDEMGNQRKAVDPAAYAETGANLVDAPVKKKKSKEKDG